MTAAWRTGGANRKNYLKADEKTKDVKSQIDKANRENIEKYRETLNFLKEEEKRFQDNLNLIDSHPMRLAVFINTEQGEKKIDDIYDTEEVETFLKNIIKDVAKQSQHWRTSTIRRLRRRIEEYEKENICVAP